MDIKANVNYHLHKDESQAFHFDVDGIVGNIKMPELVTCEVNVEDLREQKHKLNFIDDGIVLLSTKEKQQKYSPLSDWLTTYTEQVVDLLKSTIAAKEVLVFDHTVRIDNQDATRKPARNVHNDYDPQGANQRLVDLVGEKEASEYQAGHFAFVNVWRPLNSPIKSTPLGFIRPSSLDSDDWMSIELIYPDRKGSILGVAKNPAHQWFYVSAMTPNEVAIFNIFDNKGQPFLAHSALDVVDQTPTDKPRQSIETRTLIRYD